MSDYISRVVAKEKCCSFCRWEGTTNCKECEHPIDDIPAANVVEVPETGIGDLSDGFHTFNNLYRQRLILFASLVKVYKDRAWKSYRHEDGKLCFGGGWFIVGIDTPEGSYTYHYENKDFDLFDCEELPVGKHWDGHTEDDVTRLLSLSVDAVDVKHGEWKPCSHYDSGTHMICECSVCGDTVWVHYNSEREWNYCPNCGAKMRPTSMSATNGGDHNALD